MPASNDYGGRPGHRVLLFRSTLRLEQRTRELLQQLNAVIVGPVDSLVDAVYMIETGMIDAVILDVELPPETSVTIAERLLDLDIPFVFATGTKKSAKYPGFVLGDDLDSIIKIAASLFRPPTNSLN